MTHESPADSTAVLALAALGVVYGDIGTSPLYALKEVFGNVHHPVPITPGDVFGILSLVFWSLIVVVSFKYVALILRADNKGEGGIMALMARVLADEGISGRARQAVILLGLFGAALFYGDGLITPAISVLSAVEGLEVATPVFAHFVVPITLGILVALFWIQRHGTAKVGIAFGPVMILWFALLGAMGVAQIASHPGILAALLLADPGSIRNPYYLMAPDWFLLPLVGLATAATVIASQAVITGVYSITQQAIQLGYAPRMELRHTSGSQMGQIYLPGVNWMMLLGVLALVLAFKSSTNLAAAYGIAVTGTMIITTLFAYIVARRQWGWRRRLALPVFGALLALDLTFLAANSTKILEGGWFPLVFGGAVYLLLTTWKDGRKLLLEKLDTQALVLREFILAIERPDTITVPGTAVFLTPYPEHVPHALLHNLKHNKVLHEQVLLVTVIVLSEPRLPDDQRVWVDRLSRRFYSVGIRFGFMDTPDVPAALALCAEQGLLVEPMTTSYFLGRETVMHRVGSAMPYWREAVFATLYRNAGTAADFYGLPPNQVVELGTRVAL